MGINFIVYTYSKLTYPNFYEKILFLFAYLKQTKNKRLNEIHKKINVI